MRQKMEKYLKTPLYHGTDDFIVYMSKEEREDMKKICFLSSRLKNLKNYAQIYLNNLELTLHCILFYTILIFCLPNNASFSFIIKIG